MLKKSLITPLIFIWCALTLASDFKIFFLNVGEGEAIYIETPNTQKVLIDSGNLISGYKVVNFLKRKGIEEIDFLIITHPHLDHMGGIFHVLQHIKVKRCYDNGQPLPKNNDIYRWYNDLFRKDNYKPLKAGEKIILGNVIINVLSPEKFTSDWNANSLVLKINYGETSFLLMGDANIKVEKMLLEKNINLKADVLKVGHHGAKDASSERFIEAVSPQYAVISIDENNIRGYPAVSVIKRFQNKGIKLFFTYRDGDIIFKSNGKNIFIYSFEFPKKLIDQQHYPLHLKLYHTMQRIY